MDFQPMSPEEMQRAMQFLLSQQAQFAADFTRHREQFAELSAKTDRIADGLIGLTGLVGRAVEGLAAAQLRTDERLRETDARLTAHIDRVESHLNVMIEMFERHLREDHGRPPS